MSKNRPSASPGSVSGGLHGDVSFIRATSASNQSVDKMPSHLSQNPPHMPRIPPDLSLQPHLYHPHHHHRQQSQQHSNSQPYVPEHKDAQQYVLKQPHGGGGASGDSAAISRTPSHTGVEGWSERDETLVAELEEAKIRVAQMEKTMRWWSDCTSNWREKWNKARNERNKAREENRLLRAKLESVAKEFARLKREKNEASGDAETPAHGEYILSPASSINKSHDDFDHLDKFKTGPLMGHDKDNDCFDDMSETSSISKPPTNHSEYKDIDDVSTVGERSLLGERSLISELSEKLANLQEKHTLLKEEMVQVQNKGAQTQENLMVMQRKLDEANNTIQIERLENCNHMKIVEKLQKELKEAQSKLEESNMNKQELKTELDRNKKFHQDELSRLTIDLEDETVSRTSLDKQITELRRELERIQAENASEWAKRERLESEKLALERDNKKLRTQVTDLEEELEKKSHTSSSLVDSDIKTLQFELCEKTKELADLQHIHGKLKKALTERTTELDHHRRRAEQYEAEVRALRSRVDKLKHDLAASEDEVDKQRNAARKAQRTCEELQTQVDSLDVQVRHLQSRLRRNSKHGSVTSPRSTSLKSLAMEDSAELADSETDFDDV
ncbi:hypothetical protein BsWGS_16382 [Bradybaena similaris]